jgi:hypothetical protein
MWSRGATGAQRRLPFVRFSSRTVELTVQGVGRVDVVLVGIKNARFFGANSSADALRVLEHYEDQLKAIFIGLPPEIMTAIHGSYDRRELEQAGKIETYKALVGRPKKEFIPTVQAGVLSKIPVFAVDRNVTVNSVRQSEAFFKNWREYYKIGWEIVVKSVNHKMEPLEVARRLKDVAPGVSAVVGVERAMYFSLSVVAQLRQSKLQGPGTKTVLLAVQAGMEDFVDEALRKHGPSTDTTDRLNEMRKALNQYDEKKTPHIWYNMFMVTFAFGLIPYMYFRVMMQMAVDRMPSMGPGPVGGIVGDESREEDVKLERAGTLGFRWDRDARRD